MPQARSAGMASGFQSWIPSPPAPVADTDRFQSDELIHCVTSHFRHFSLHTIGVPRIWKACPSARHCVPPGFVQQPVAQIRRPDKPPRILPYTSNCEQRYFMTVFDTLVRQPAVGQTRNYLKISYC